MAILQSSGRLVRRFVALALPPVCAVCGCRIQSAAGLGVCPPCWSGLERLAPENEPALDTLLASSVFTAFYAPFVYSGEVVGLLNRLKYYGTPQLAAALAPFMLATLPPHARYDVVVPVPMARWRLFKRGYNQAAELARPIAAALKLPCDPLSLRRVAGGGRQVGRGRAARLKALTNAFNAQARFNDKTVLLVDDVLTTGSTANACAKALRAAGAKRVDVLTAAWVRP